MDLPEREFDRRIHLIGQIQGIKDHTYHKPDLRWARMKWMQRERMG